MGAYSIAVSAGGVKKQPKVALVHDFLTQYGGGERVLDIFREMFPDATIYTLIHDPAKLKGRYKGATVTESPLAGFPLAQARYKYYLPLMPWAIEHIDLPDDLDLVLSDCSAFTKGVRAPHGVPHICYLHTPTRYLWSVQDEYLANSPAPSWAHPFVRTILNRMKRWDYLAAQKPDFYIANSKNIAGQLQQYYDRPADAVLFPAVDAARFKIAEPDDYFLVLARMEPYKRFDLAIEACIQLGMRLKVVGTGTQFAAITERYKSPLVEFLGWVPDEQLPELYAKAKAFIFPQEEDAGITPLEAMASGCPVVAFGRGGALESVIPGKTGEFFQEQTTESLAKTLAGHDWTRYNRKAIRRHAEQFDTVQFKRRMIEHITEVLDTYHQQPTG